MSITNERDFVGYGRTRGRTRPRGTTARSR